MSESTAICGDFPHTAGAKTNALIRQMRERKQQSVARLSATQQHVDGLVCAKLFDGKQLFGLAALRSPCRARALTRARKIIWLILRRHPDAKVSVGVLANAYRRDYSTIVRQCQLYSDQLAHGYWRADAAIIQSVCDALAERGFRRVNLGELL